MSSTVLHTHPALHAALPSDASSVAHASETHARSASGLAPAHAPKRAPHTTLRCCVVLLPHAPAQAPQAPTCHAGAPQSCRLQTRCSSAAGASAHTLLSSARAYSPLLSARMQISVRVCTPAVLLLTPSQQDCEHTDHAVVRHSGPRVLAAAEHGRAVTAASLLQLHASSPTAVAGAGALALSGTVCELRWYGHVCCVNLTGAPNVSGGCNALGVHRLLPTAPICQLVQLLAVLASMLGMLRCDGPARNSVALVASGVSGCTRAAQAAPAAGQGVT